MNIKNIVALVSAGRHPISGQARHCRNDSLAMTIGLELAGKLNAENENSVNLKVMHAGNANNAALTDYLALGANQIDVIPALENADIVDSLADKLKNVDVILTGSRAESGQDSGLLPYLLAEKLNYSLVANVLSIKQTTEGIEALQFLPKGKRRSVKVQMPAIIVIHPLASIQLRHAYARQVNGHISQFATHTPTPELKSSCAAEWQMQSTIRKPNKLKAKENKSGHARMLSATVSENKGGAVVNDGNSVEKAQVILSYLREHRLINF